MFPSLSFISEDSSSFWHPLIKRSEIPVKIKGSIRILDFVFIVVDILVTINYQSKLNHDYFTDFSICPKDCSKSAKMARDCGCLVGFTYLF